MYCPESTALSIRVMVCVSLTSVAWGGWMIFYFSLVKVHFVFCYLNSIVLFPYLIKYYHIVFIIILFWLGRDRQFLFVYARFTSFHTHLSSSFLLLYPEWPQRQGGCLACCMRLHFRFPLTLHWFILCTRRSGGTAHEGGGCDQSIGSTVTDAIVYRWLWLTATSSSWLPWRKRSFITNLPMAPASSTEVDGPEEKTNQSCDPPAPSVH